MIKKTHVFLTSTWNVKDKGVGGVGGAGQARGKRIWWRRRRRLTRMSERSAGSGAGVRAAVVPEEVRMERSGSVAELELDLGRTGKVREPGLLVVQRARAHVQREPAHLPRAPVERAPAHGRQLFQPPFFAPLVLEPHLRTREAQRFYFQRS